MKRLKKTCSLCYNFLKLSICIIKYYIYILPSSFRNNLLNLSPLGSLPTYLCTYSVPRSFTAIAYFKGFTQDWRQNGTLVSPTECLWKTQMKRLEISCLPAVTSRVLNDSFILRITRTINKNNPKKQNHTIKSHFEEQKKWFKGFNNCLHKLSITKPLADPYRDATKQKEAQKWVGTTGKNHPRPLLTHLPYSIADNIINKCSCLYEIQFSFGIPGQ